MTRPSMTECPHCHQHIAAVDRVAGEKRLVMVGIIRHIHRSGRHEHIREVRLGGIRR